ncbi:MAG: hypothetical protein QM486_04955 [Flavobacteriaceae bacterium]
MKFSERLGYKTVRKNLQFESIDINLLNSMWSIFLDLFLLKLEHKNYHGVYEKYNYTYSLWLNYFKWPTDKSPINLDKSVNIFRLKEEIHSYLYSDSTNWFEIYDFFEFSSRYFGAQCIEMFNKIFEREKAAYRFINGQIAPISSNEEISEIEQASEENNEFKSVSIHLNTSLKYLSDRENPDYRNSVKESISAVESICKIFTNDDKATLGKTLKVLESNGDIHPALKKAFTSLYGYTSDDAGIRHSLMEGSREIDFFEAKFMLATCSSFINLLKGKMS